LSCFSAFAGILLGQSKKKEVEVGLLVLFFSRAMDFTAVITVRSDLDSTLFASEEQFLVILVTTNTSNTLVHHLFPWTNQP